MNFAIVSIAALIAVLALKPVIAKVPALLYAISIVLVALFLSASLLSFPIWAKQLLYALVQKGTLALSLFCIVMYIGALPSKSWFASRLSPIRGELSIAACILICGHMYIYLASYIPRIASHPIGVTVAIALCVALVLLLLVAILGITSIPMVKKRMRASTWTKLQKLSYVFFVLVFVHLALMLVPSAMQGSSSSIASMIVYVLVFGAYAVLRIAKYFNDKRDREQGAMPNETVA